MCTILLTQDTPEGRLKAIGFCEQAVGVIEEYQNSAVQAHYVCLTPELARHAIG
mgnify:CR=1 FL=1